MFRSPARKIGWGEIIGFILETLFFVYLIWVFWLFGSVIGINEWLYKIYNPEKYWAEQVEKLESRINFGERAVRRAETLLKKRQKELTNVTHEAKNQQRKIKKQEMKPFVISDDYILDILIGSLHDDPKPARDLGLEINILENVEMPRLKSALEKLKNKLNENKKCLEQAKKELSTHKLE